MVEGVVVDLWEWLFLSWKEYVEKWYGEDVVGGGMMKYEE